MKRWIIVGIMCSAAVLRLYAIGHVPPAASLDEASIGYNAYAILQTGKDEYGAAFPLLLRAYDDFRPALYVYLVMPFVWVFGLGVLAVRLPSVILSLATVYGTYLLARDIGKKYLSYDFLGEVAAGILAISPWHIYISRLGHEANVGLALVTLGTYLFFVFLIKKNGAALVASAACFGLSLHGYQSEKIVTPFLLGAGAILFWKDLWKQKKTTILAIILWCIIALPAIVVTLSPQGLSRFSGTSAFSSTDPDMAFAKENYVAAQKSGNRLAQIQYGAYGAGAKIFLRNYASHFSIRWLFTGGKTEAFKAPNIGLLYMWEVLFLGIGLWAFLKSKLPRNMKMFLAAWILISPVPASITTQAPHAMRAYTLLPGIQIIEAFGFWYIVSKMTQKTARASAIIALCVIGAAGTAFWNDYFVKFPKEQSQNYQYAMKEAVNYARDNSSTYSSVQFSHTGNLYQSYMFFLFYTAYDPQMYLRHGGTVSGGYDQSHNVGKYAFGYLPRMPSQFLEHVLYFYNAHDVPSGVRVVATFDSLDGSPAIVAATL